MEIVKVLLSVATWFTT